MSLSISLFTPTHDTTHLSACYQTLCAQTQQDFEWILVPNNGAVIPEEIARDSRVSVHPYQSREIGALKRYAVERCNGSVIVEVDHDDLLASAALEEVARAAETSGFIYSDFAEFKTDGSYRRPYNPQHGWEYYSVLKPDFPAGLPSRSVQAMKALPLTPSSLSEIFYAPNHIRAWRRDAYWAAGGHNPKLAVGDDHDLICRTYLAGVSFGHIPKCLYFYRCHAANTVWTNNRDIQRQQATNREHYLPKLIHEWCRRGRLPEHELKILIWDLPYEDNSAGCVRADNLLQRLVTPAEIARLWNEVYRVLVPGGFFCIRMPRAYGSSHWIERSFGYFTVRHLAARLPGLRCRFQLVSMAMDRGHIVATLSALRGQRQPGLCAI